MDEDESGKSQYAYFSSSLGLLRVEISNIEHKPKCEDIELVLHDESGEIPISVGLFSHSNIIYLVGGLVDGDRDKDSSLVLKFNHNKFQQDFSMKKFEFLDKTLEDYEPMMFTHVIPTPAGDKTYFLSDTCLHSIPEAFSFQSFDVTKNCFTKHPNPPIDSDPSDRQPYHGEFLLGSCLYKFVVKLDFTSQVFTFNTMSSSSIWKENEWLASQFDMKSIPAPNDHRGDVGLSDEFDDTTRIMVALHCDHLIAYRVQVEAGWESFEPISYRLLKESHIPDPAIRSGDRWTHLTDLGGARFCVVYGSDYTDLIMYVFSIDFALEHDIHVSDDSKRTSSNILSSRIFRFQQDLKNLPSSPDPSITSDFCFLSAHPASPASPATEKDQERMIDKMKSLILTSR